MTLNRLVSFASARIHPRPIIICTIICFTFGAARVLAEGGAGLKNEFSITGGALLPNRIPNVTEVLTLWDIRASRHTNRGIFEVDGAFAQDAGSTYNSLSVDYRYDIENEAVNLFAMLGAQADYFRGLGQADSKLSGGWNIGGGAFFPVTESLSLRADFRYRFGPGTSILILAGFALRLPGTGN